MENQLLFISNCHAHKKTRCGRNCCLTMWARGISQIVPPNWSTARNRVACATVSPLTYFCSPLLNSVLLFVTHFVEFKCRVFVRVLCIQRMALFLQCYTSLDCPYRKKNKFFFQISWSRFSFVYEIQPAVCTVEIEPLFAIYKCI